MPTITKTTTLQLLECPNWVIVGGESGPKARPMDLAWARDIVRQCREAGVPVFVKQLGTHPTESGTRYPLRDLKGGNPQEWPEDIRVREFPENVHAPEGSHEGHDAAW